MGKVIIGIDQSYTDTGISIFINGKLYKLDHIGKVNKETNVHFRNRFKEYLIDEINGIYAYCVERDDNATFEVITERIRLKSGGHISESYIKSTAALISVIIEVAESFDIPVYSVDTRGWKKAIIGTTKPQKNRYGIDSNKYPTILYMRAKGLLKEIAEPYKGKGKKGVVMVNMGGQKVPCKINDNKADAYCIGLYGYQENRKLVREIF